LSVKIRSFAVDHGIIVAYEKLKESVKDGIEKVKDVAAEGKQKVIDAADNKKRKRKASFVFPFRSPKTLEESLTQYMNSEKR
jgi:hypothetical protein